MQCYFTIHGARLYFVFLTEEGLTVTESKRFERCSASSRTGWALNIRQWVFTTNFFLGFVKMIPNPEVGYFRNQEVKGISQERKNKT